MLVRQLRPEEPTRNTIPRDLERESGEWHPADIQWMAELVQDVPGDFAEIGVFRGRNFKNLLRRSITQGKVAHAFDSFVGMDQPSAEDGPYYSRGKFDIGGPQQFVANMTSWGFHPSVYRVWPGYIPDCFTGVSTEQTFSLVVVDVDQYRPTAESLRWVCPRINRHGILALDDAMSPAAVGAAQAIDEFLAQDTSFEYIAFQNYQLILRKK